MMPLIFDPHRPPALKDATEADSELIRDVRLLELHATETHIRQVENLIAEALHRAPGGDPRQRLKRGAWRVPSAVACLLYAIRPAEPEQGRLHWLQQAIRTAIQPWPLVDVQALAAWLTEYAAHEARSKKHAHTDAARDTRKHAIAECAEHMDDTSQQHLANLAGALADATPKRHERLRAATRNFVRETFAFDDFAWMARACIGWMQGHHETQGGGE